MRSRLHPCPRNIAKDCDDADSENCTHLPAKWFWALLSYRWSMTWPSCGEGNHGVAQWVMTGCSSRTGQRRMESQRRFACFSSRPWLWGVHSDTLTNVSQPRFLTPAKLCGRLPGPPGARQMGTWKASRSPDKSSKIWGDSANQANICRRNCFRPSPCHVGGLLAQLDLCSCDLCSVFWDNSYYCIDFQNSQYESTSELVTPQCMLFGATLQET